MAHPLGISQYTMEITGKNSENEKNSENKSKSANYNTSI